MFWEFLAGVVALDVHGLVSFLFSNLYWVFAFGALAFWYFPKKNIFAGIILISFFMWSFVDLTLVFGWVYLVAGFLALNYISRIAVLAFTESDEILRKHTLLIMVIQFYVTWIFYNLFIA